MSDWPRRLLLFGGSADMALRGDTWAWDGTEWTEVMATGPRARFVSLMTDTRLGGILLQGGHGVDGNDGGFLADTWHWDGTAWSEVATSRRTATSASAASSAAMPSVS